MSLAALPVDAVFATFGVAASYTPPGGGAAVACTIVLGAADQEETFGQTRLVASDRRIEIRAAEMVPARNGQFVVGAETLKVLSDPRRQTHDGGVLVMTAAKV